MEKLKLEHLAPYLPYSLKLKGDDGSVAILTTGSGISLGCYSLEWVIRAQKCKPILRPLSDLTKGFYVNDEEITPCDYFEEHHDYAKIQSELKNMSNHNYCDGWLPYFVQQKLIEWHFDVFSLIPKGLAVDINTLTK